MLNKKSLSLVFFLILIGLTFINAFEFNGTVYDINGTVLNNSVINVTIRNNNFGIIGYNWTESNATGWFNMTVTDNANWFYEPVVYHFQNNASNDGTYPIDSVGQAVPAFPHSELSKGLSTDFYLRPGGTIIISVSNGTKNLGLGIARRNFRYQIKDQTLNFPIHEAWTETAGVTVYVPSDRNYSIMVYPNDSMPLSFDWNNFSGATVNYNLTNNNLTTYNVTSNTLDKEFNTSMTLVGVNGTIFNSSTGNATSWDEFQVVVFLMEAGEVIYLGSNSFTFYNISAWDSNQADFFNKTNGFYNITVPGSTETTNFLLLATARNGTNYYGGYRNISPSYGDNDIEANFTMYPLMGTGWGTTNDNITVKDPTTYASIGINTSKQTFNIVNSSNSTLNGIEATLEVTLDYTNYNATKFTFMSSLAQGSTSSFYFPLINSTGIEQINVYSMNGAPKRIGKKTAQQILDGANNITLSSFNPRDIDGTLTSGLISVSIYKSNVTCDVPSPPASCVLTSSTTMTTFKPLSTIIGGGSISFRMGAIASGIEIHYVNVDMLASGPPDALFDNSTTNTSASGTFASAMRFGSGGPTIYDFVLVSMPYSEGSTTIAGLNESNDVNMSIPTLYDEDWNIIWNVTTNGTNGTDLANNFSHYSTFSSDWNTLLSPTNCTTNVTNLNATNPCYIDKTNNKIWIRLPHFSGTRPNLDATVTTITTSPSTSGGGSSGGGGATASYWTLTSTVTKEEFEEGYTKNIGIKERIKINIDNENHYVGLISLTGSTAIINISSTPQQATLSIGDLRKFDINDNGFYDLSVLLNSITNNKASLTIKAISEKISEENETLENEKEERVEKAEGDSKDVENINNFKWPLIILIIIIILLIVSFIYFKFTKKS